MGGSVWICGDVDVELGVRDLSDDDASGPLL